MWTHRERGARELPHCIGTGRVHGSNGHHIGGIATGINRGVAEAAVLGMQSVPHRIQKKTFRQVVIRLKMHVGVAAPGWLDCKHRFLPCCRQILSLRFRQAKLTRIEKTPR
jgi:hypothetical protein